ncbi:hypothetical protein CCUS01_04566 [Colletotrichum cuscutae]|uniref:Uncharacterized protein n=1 Tax=Colletotrichum cuscutae TaxID=1209917 RepID=A0AAI9Y7H9_9PEZI|nr:hypothetical protein CCUS01_04566 [Colletotrichum cuscutae]
MCGRARRLWEQLRRGGKKHITHNANTRRERTREETTLATALCAVMPPNQRVNSVGHRNALPEASRHPKAQHRKAGCQARTERGTRVTVSDRDPEAQEETGVARRDIRVSLRLSCCHASTAIILLVSSALHRPPPAFGEGQDQDQDQEGTPGPAPPNFASSAPRLQFPLFPESRNSRSVLLFLAAMGVTRNLIYHVL